LGDRPNPRIPSSFIIQIHTNYCYGEVLEEKSSPRAAVADPAGDR